jgi:hypothetical protein
MHQSRSAAPRPCGARDDSIDHRRIETKNSSFDFVVFILSSRNSIAAICSAMSHPEIPRIAIKTIAQQSVQAWHRVRGASQQERQDRQGDPDP